MNLFIRCLFVLFVLVSLSGCGGDVAIEDGPPLDENAMKNFADVGGPAPGAPGGAK